MMVFAFLEKVSRCFCVGIYYKENTTVLLRFISTCMLTYCAEEAMKLGQNPTARIAPKPGKFWDGPNVNVFMLKW
jgi:hypothetical protein